MKYREGRGPCPAFLRSFFRTSKDYLLPFLNTCCPSDLPCDRGPAPRQRRFSIFSSPFSVQMINQGDDHGGGQTCSQEISGDDVFVVHGTRFTHRHVTPSLTQATPKISGVTPGYPGCCRGCRLLIWPHLLSGGTVRGRCRTLPWAA